MALRSSTAAAGKHVVIGGLGNLGQHIQRVLLGQGKSITVLDRHLPKGRRPVLQDSSIEYVRYSLGADDPSELKAALRGAETVYSVVTPDVQHGTVRDFEQTNHIGLQHIVDSCREAGVAKLVYASSLAVTNHFVVSRNVKEDAPLPDISTYVTSYDRTKRLGEELVLAANSTNLQTCALRLGGILSSPTDYYMRGVFQMGEASGRVNTMSTEPCDCIAGHDVARAMFQADLKLSSSTNQLGGRALYVTKDAKGKPLRADQIHTYLAELLGWQVTIVPQIVLPPLIGALWLQYHLYTGPFTKDSQDLPGMPPHRYLELTKYEKSFDNAMAHKILDFKPEFSWEQAVENIVEEYKARTKSHDA